MLVKERRHRQKLEMRQTILDVAKDIAATDGWQNVTIRKICDRIHYTAPVIYQYFESKEMILLSLRQEGMSQVYTIFEEVDKKHSDANKRLIEYGFAWWHFALNNPELYQVMYNLQGAVCTGTGGQSTVISFYHTAFAAINRKAKRSEKFRLELCDHLIAVIHGFIMMRMVNKIRSGNEHSEQVYKHALQRFIQSIHDKN
jgi:AcrR family transcriptional regulator